MTTSRSRRFVILFSDAEFTDLSRRANADHRPISSYARELLFPAPLAVEFCPSRAKPDDDTPATVLVCKKCGNRWSPRGASPKQCPKCKSPEWNTSTAQTYADRVAQLTAEADAIGISIEEYNRQRQEVTFYLTQEEDAAHARRWKRIREESGISAETWEAAKWISGKPPSIIAGVEAEENLFDAIQKIRLDT